MKRIKTISDTVKVFIYVLDGALEIDLLLSSKFGGSNSVRWLACSML